MQSKGFLSTGNNKDEGFQTVDSLMMTKAESLENFEEIVLPFVDSLWPS